MTRDEEDQDQEAGIRLTGLEFIEGRNSGPAWLRKLFDQADPRPDEAEPILPRWDCTIEEQAESIFGKAKSDIKYVIWKESGSSITPAGYEFWEVWYDDQGRISYYGYVLDRAGDDRAREVDLRERRLRRADPS